MIYTTHGLAGLNAKLRRSVGTRGHSQAMGRAMKLIWLQLRERKMPRREWSAAKAPPFPRAQTMQDCVPARGAGSRESWLD